MYKKLNRIKSEFVYLIDLILKRLSLSGDSEMIWGLNKYEKAVRGRGHNVHRQQASITSYFDR